MGPDHGAPRTMRLLYPECRFINAAEVLQWAADLYADSAPRRRCRGCGVVTVAERDGQPVAEVRSGEWRAGDPAHPCDCGADDEALHDADQERPAGLEACADYLENSGVATFARDEEEDDADPRDSDAMPPRMSAGPWGRG